MSPRFPCDRFLRISDYAQKPAMATLFNTFGRSESCIKKFALRYQYRPHVIEIHYDNQTCRRKPRKCFRQELFPSMGPAQYSRLLEKMRAGTERKILSRVRAIFKITTKAGSDSTRWILSTGLEDNYTHAAYKRLLTVIRKEWPYEIARNPASDRAFIGRADFAELHSPTADFGGLPCIWNQDGLAGGVPEFKAKFIQYYRCEIIFAWDGDAQGVTKFFAPPLQRFFYISEQKILAYGKAIAPRKLSF